MKASFKIFGPTPSSNKQTANGCVIILCGPVRISALLCMCCGLVAVGFVSDGQKNLAEQYANFQSPEAKTDPFEYAITHKPCQTAP